MRSLTKKIKIHESNTVKYGELANGLSVQRCLHWQGFGKSTKLFRIWDIMDMLQILG